MVAIVILSIFLANCISEDSEGNVPPVVEDRSAMNKTPLPTTKQETAKSLKTVTPNVTPDKEIINGWEPTKKKEVKKDEDWGSTISKITSSKDTTTYGRSKH